MAVETAADRAVFVNPDEFGVTASYTPVGGSATDVDGIFDSGFSAVEIDAGVPLGSSALRFTARTADLPNVSEGATLVIDGTTYTVRAFEPDGTGMTVCVLEEA